MSDVESALDSLVLDHHDDVVVVISDQLAPQIAAGMARRIHDRLSEARVPSSQRTWIIATTGDDEAAAKSAAVVSDLSGSARVVVHDPRELDDLTFERRVPGQRRGGIYLNHAWQSASVRISCGDPLEVVDGLSAWFNPVARLSADDLHADLLLGG